MQTNQDGSAAQTSAALLVAPQDAFGRLKADVLNARERFNTAVWSLSDDICSLTMLSDCAAFRSQARHNRTVLLGVLLGSTASVHWTGPGAAAALPRMRPSTWSRSAW